jgi:hypothetical protein
MPEHLDPLAEATGRVVIAAGSLDGPWVCWPGTRWAIDPAGPCQATSMPSSVGVATTSTARATRKPVRATRPIERRLCG